MSSASNQAYLFAAPRTKGGAVSGTAVKPHRAPLKRPPADVIKVLRLAQQGKMPNLADHGLMTGSDTNTYVLQWAASYLAGIDAEHALERLKKVAAVYKESQSK